MLICGGRGDKFVGPAQWILRAQKYYVFIILILHVLLLSALIVRVRHVLYAIPPQIGEQISTSDSAA